MWPFKKSKDIQDIQVKTAAPGQTVGTNYFYPVQLFSNLTGNQNQYH